MFVAAMPASGCGRIGYARTSADAGSLIDADAGAFVDAGADTSTDSSVSDGCVAVAESCNGADHDCDGASDEDFDNDLSACVACATRSNVGSVCSSGTCGQAIGAGAQHTCVISAAGETKCWGNNFSGQLGRASPVVDPVEARAASTTSAMTAASVTSGGAIT